MKLDDEESESVNTTPRLISIEEYPDGIKVKGLPKCASKSIVAIPPGAKLVPSLPQKLYTGTPAELRKTTFVSEYLYRNLEDELFLIVALTAYPPSTFASEIPEIAGNSLLAIELFLGVVIGARYVFVAADDL